MRTATARRGRRQLAQPRRRPPARPAVDARRDLVRATGRRAGAAGRAGARALSACRSSVERLERQLEVGQRLRVEQLAQLLLAEQLAQQVAVERQRAGPALGQRRVALVHVGGDVVEQQRRRERRGLRASRRAWTAISRRSIAAEHLAQRGAGRTRPTGTRGTSRRGSGSCRSATPPASRSAARWRCCQSGVRAPGPAARQEQRPGRVLAEARREQRRAADRLDDQVLDLVGGREQQRLDLGEPARVAVALALGQPDGDPVVRPDRLDLDARAARAAAPRSPAPTARGPGRRTASGCTSRQSPSSSRKRCDDDPPVGRQRARDLALLVEVGDAGCAAASSSRSCCSRSRARERARPRSPARQVALGLAQERADRPAELDRPPDRVALPERQLAGHAGRRLDDDPVGRDVVRPASCSRRARSRRRASRRGARRPSPRRARRRAGPACPASPARNTPNRPRSGIVPPLVTATTRASRRPSTTSVTRSQTIRGLQLRELVRRVGAGEHPQHPLERLAATASRTAPRGVTTSSSSSTVQRSIDGHRDDLLGEHVERVARHDRRLDRALVHPLRRRPRTRAGRRGTWGRSRPCDGSPTWWPARPMRCSPRGDARRRSRPG